MTRLARQIIVQSTKNINLVALHHRLKRHQNCKTKEINETSILKEIKKEPSDYREFSFPSSHWDKGLRAARNSIFKLSFEKDPQALRNLNTATDQNSSTS